MTNDYSGVTPLRRDVAGEVMTAAPAQPGPT